MKVFLLACVMLVLGSLGAAAAAGLSLQTTPTTIVNTDNLTGP